MALGPLCGIEIRLVHLSTCDEAGPATSGRPGDGPALGVKDPPPRGEFGGSILYVLAGLFVSVVPGGPDEDRGHGQLRERACARDDPNGTGNVRSD